MATSSTVVRLSVRWIFVAAALMLAFGVVGGVIAVRLIIRPTPLLPERDQLITTVQEVTVSPSRAAQALVADHERSVLLLVHGSRTNPTVLAAGAAVTNDGVLASVHPATSAEVFGIDNTGAYVTLDAIGRDSLYGITFYRVREGVVAPLEIASADGTVGAGALALSRDAGTNQPIVEPISIQQYELPSDSDPVAWYRLAHLTPAKSLLPGTPLLADTGQISGMIVGDGQAIPSSYLRRSLERLAAGKREDNPFANLGFTVRPRFAVGADGSGIEFAFVVTGVEPGSASALLRAGDKLIAINNQEVTWEANLVDLLSVAPPITATVERAGREQDVIIGAPPTL